MGLNMAGSQGDHIKQLSKYTAITIHHTRKGIVNLCQYFLAISWKHVPLGQFTTDPLEKEFSKLCQGSGGTYFINVQQWIEKLHIKKTGHQYTSCGYKLCEEGSEIFDKFENFEPSLSDRIKMDLVDITGHITRNEDQYSEYETHFIMRSMENIPILLTAEN